MALCLFDSFVWLGYSVDTTEQLPEAESEAGSLQCVWLLGFSLSGLPVLSEVISTAAVTTAAAVLAALREKLRGMTTVLLLFRGL